MRNKTALVIGSSEREHSFAKLLASSKQVDRVWVYPGNAGTDQFGEPIKANFELNDPEGLLTIAEMFDVDLTIVGPEVPAVCGTADVFQKAGRLILCPNKTAAQLEGSKVWAKYFMERHGIPTAKFMVATTADFALKVARAMHFECVIKADGLCDGKGVYVCHSEVEVRNAISDLMEKRIFGNAGDKVVIEEVLVGVESSYFILVHRRIFVKMRTAGDHKAALDGDKGPNTGGIGAFYPCPFVNGNPTLEDGIIRDIVEPTIQGMADEDIPYVGFLYIGLMLTTDGPKVVEFNVRFGNPEAQVILPMLEDDAFELFQAGATGDLTGGQTHWLPGVQVGVTLLSGNYPEKEGIGFKAKITGPVWHDDWTATQRVYHGSTFFQNNELFTSGGRALTAVGRGDNYGAAIENAYDLVKKIHFPTMRYRRDIGRRAFAALR